MVIVDGNNILHSTYHIAKFRAQSDDHYIKAFLMRFKSIKRNFGDLHIVFDGKNNKDSNIAILSEYKSNRESLAKNIANLFNTTKRLLKYSGYKIVNTDGFEADQIIASMALKSAENGEEVIVISTDKDFNQLISDKIKIYDPRVKEYRTKEMILEKYKVEPSQFAFFLTLNGDSIDGVSGLPRCGPVNAAKFIAKYKTFKNAVQTLSESSFALSSWDSEFVKHLDHLKNCYKVVKLKKLDVDFSVSSCAIDSTKLKSICEKRKLDYEYLYGLRKF